MAIDFNLGLRALQTFGEEATRSQQMDAQRQQMQQRDYGFQQQQRQDQARPQIQQQAAGGDFAGAAAQAFSLGDYDALKYVGGMEAAKHAQLAGEADTIGRLATSLIGLPADQRAQAFAAVAPQLKQAGFDDSELAAVQLDDGALQAYIKLATDTKTALESYSKSQDPYTLNRGDKRFANGQLIAENNDPPPADWIFDSEGGNWLQKPGTGGGGPVAQPGYAPQAAMPQGGAGGPLAAMMSITAQTESGNRDYLPNGQLVTSPKGAQGAMQTMPGTQRDPGFGVAPARDGSVEEKNRVGRDYLAAMMQRYGGDEAKAWAAYNAGPGRVDQALQSRGENWLAGMPGETRAYVAKNVGQMGGAAGQRPGVINVRAPKRKERAAPSGYEWNGDALRPIRGGPADPSTSTNRNVQSNRKAEGDLRSKFDALPEVKTFKTARQQFNTLRDLAQKKNPSGSDDLAIIFNFMKTLDPASVVREGEFLQAANSAGFVEGVGNRFQRAQNGQWLNPQQRKAMVRTAYRNYSNYRDAYNQTAESYRGYAQDYGVSPDRVARRYKPDQAQPKADRMSQFKIVKVR